MKASLITLLPLACFSLAAPAAKVEAKSIVSPPVTSSELADRGLLSPVLDLTSGSNSDATSLPALSQLSVLVNQVLNTVRGIEDTLAGAEGKNLTTLLPTVTDQLTGIQTALSGLQGLTSGLTGTVQDVTQIAGVTALLAQLTNALATLLAQITTLSSRNVPFEALNPVTTLLAQLLTTVYSVLDLNILSPNGPQ